RTAIAACSPFTNMIAAIATVSRNCTSTMPNPPSAATNQLATPPAYGAALATKGSTPLAATLSQNNAAFPPKSGTADNHPGGGGSLKAARDVAPSVIRSKLSAMVV